MTRRKIPKLRQYCQSIYRKKKVLLSVENFSHTFTMKIQFWILQPHTPGVVWVKTHHNIMLYKNIYIFFLRIGNQLIWEMKNTHFYSHDIQETTLFLLCVFSKKKHSEFFWRIQKKRKNLKVLLDTVMYIQYKEKEVSIENPHSCLKHVDAKCVWLATSFMAHKKHLGNIIHI